MTSLLRERKRCVSETASWWVGFTTVLRGLSRISGWQPWPLTQILGGWKELFLTVSWCGGDRIVAKDVISALIAGFGELIGMTSFKPSGPTCTQITKEAKSWSFYSARSQHLLTFNTQPLKQAIRSHIIFLPVPFRSHTVFLAPLHYRVLRHAPPKFFSLLYIFSCFL